MLNKIIMLNNVFIKYSKHHSLQNLLFDSSITENASFFKEGTFASFFFLSGVFKFGIWYNGSWEGGIWKNGLWVRGSWSTGVWENGFWKFGQWNDGEWKGGYILNKHTKKYQYSEVNPRKTKWSYSYYEK